MANTGEKLHAINVGMELGWAGFFLWSLPLDESADLPDQFRHVASSIQADVGFLFEHLPYLSFGVMSVRGINFLHLSFPVDAVVVCEQSHQCLGKLGISAKD
jgi:hypothetical protein